jgi:acetyl-CoA C-acetyltransferase
MTAPAWIAGAVQRSFRASDPGWTPRDPAALMAEVGKDAIADAGLGRDDIDLVACVEPISWTYDDLAGRVAAALSLHKDARSLWKIAGGTSPQDLLHEVAARIAAGECEAALIAGAEAGQARARARREKTRLDWPARPEGYNPFRGQKPVALPLEQRHGLTAPIHVFPLFENGLRAHHGRSFEQQIALASRLLAKNNRVAVDNPHAWFREPLSAEQIATPSADNRMVCYPYTKRMNAFPEVDQAAALIVVSARKAEALRLPAPRRIALLGGAGAEDAWHGVEKISYAASPALNAVLRFALDAAALDASAIDLFDFYSCFPCAIELAVEALGLSPDDPRPFTATGGLSFAGGPGNEYVMHSLAAAVDSLRNQRARTALVTGLGMAASKFTASVISNDPKVIAGASYATRDRIDCDHEGPRVVDAADGPAVIDTYTIEYDRENRPARAILVLRLPDGSRTMANGPPHDEFCAALLAREPIGRAGIVRHDAVMRTNQFVFAD